MILFKILVLLDFWQLEAFVGVLEYGLNIGFENQEIFVFLFHEEHFLIDLRDHLKIDFNLAVDELLNRLLINSDVSSSGQQLVELFGFFVFFVLFLIEFKLLKTIIGCH